MAEMIVMIILLSNEYKWKKSKINKINKKSELNNV